MGTEFTVKINEYIPLRELVFTTLRQAILKGELEPGERLMEIQLAEKMGVSRTPIREAIRKLEKEGLVSMIPRKGAEVASISPKMMKDVLEVRMTLEKMAFQLSLKRGEKKDVEKLSEAQKEFEEAVASGDIVEMSSADEKFHFIIYEMAHNDKLRELLYNLRENMYRYRIEYLKNETARNSLIEEHRAIIDCIINKKDEKGIEVVGQHISNQETAVGSMISAGQ